MCFLCAVCGVGSRAAGVVRDGCDPHGDVDSTLGCVCVCVRVLPFCRWMPFRCQPRPRAQARDPGERAWRGPRRRVCRRGACSSCVSLSLSGTYRPLPCPLPIFLLSWVRMPCLLVLLCCTGTSVCWFQRFFRIRIRRVCRRALLSFLAFDCALVSMASLLV